VRELEQTLLSIDLHDMFVNGIGKLGLFPRNVYLPREYFFQDKLWRRWDIETKLVNENLVRGVQHLVCPP
jgi:hypothetical protein